jgi:hypothetical protein
VELAARTVRRNSSLSRIQHVLDGKLASEVHLLEGLTIGKTVLLFVRVTERERPLPERRQSCTRVKHINSALEQGGVE